MKTKTAKKCLEIMDRMEIANSLIGINYVRECLEQEVEKNEFRQKAIEESIKQGATPVDAVE